MKKLIVVFVSLFLFSCAAGPVYIAKNESEGIKNSYEEAQLRTLYNKNKPLLRDIYTRLTSSRIDIYREGIGFTTLKDDTGDVHYYLMVKIRPSEVVFDEKSSKAEQRFSKVLGGYFEKYLSSIKRDDIERSGVDGVSLGVYWPVRDFSQCKENGGFIEYIIVYVSKEDLNSILEGYKSFAEVASDAEIIASLDLKPPTYMRPVYQ
jgi:hypothetical protein